MVRRSILALLASTVLLPSSPLLAQGLTPEHAPAGAPAEPFRPQPWNEMVDAKSSACILDLINNAVTPEELAAQTEDDLATAELILATRDAQPKRRLASLAQLQPVWAASPATFPRLYCLCGPMAMGRWDTLPYETPWSAVNTVLLKTGKVLFFEESNSVRTILWDPDDLVTPIFIAPDNDPQFSQWCSQTVQLGDGRVLSVGGGGGSTNSNSDQAHIFDPTAGVNGVWTRINDMNFERWYPSVVALGNGNHLVVGGNSSAGTVAPMEMYNESTGLFTVLLGASSHLFWEPLYPGLHQLPNGQIVFTRTGFSGDPPTPLTQFFTWGDLGSPVTGTWHDLGPLSFPERQEAMSLQFLEPTNDLYEQRSSILLVGGGQSPIPGSKTAELLDCKNLSVGAAWEPLPDMVEPRHHAQGILLPDGKAIIWGGANHGNNGLTGSFSSELFDPYSNTFVRQDDLQYARGYHSAAALLPSGKVLATGGIDGPFERTMEIYSPPYLFMGHRPVMTSIPSQATHGQPFDIFTPHATQIAKVVLVRPVSNTHNTDSEQRVIQLHFTRDPAAGMVTARMPHGVQPHPHAPRGHYLLFILDSKGVPSVGQFIHLN